MRVRTALVVALLALVVGLLAVTAQATLLSRRHLQELESRVRTLIELREAGAFGTGGFGGDKPVGEEEFTLETLENVKRIPSAQHLARIDEYVYLPQIDTTRGNFYAMVIGMPPDAGMRAIGEVDYENARILAGRRLRADDADRDVAVVGILYAQQRLGLSQPADATLENTRLSLNGRAFDVVGIYSTDNDFGDNHVFTPITAFRRTFNPGHKLSKIFLTVDSVQNVEQVVTELKASLPEADVVTTPESVAAARVALGGISTSGTLGSLLLFLVGAVLVSLTMVVVVRERTAEIATLKAIGAPSSSIMLQFLAEVAALALMAGAGGVVVAALASPALRRLLDVGIAFDAAVLSLILAGCLAFMAIGSLYPVLRVARLRPVEAMRRA